jgi:hypothetical protein
MELIVIGVSVVLVFLIFILPSIRVIGATQLGLVRKRFGAKLPGDNPIAFKGEAGYQADLLMPGWRWKFWIIYSVSKYPWVQVPAGEIGVVISQAGEHLPEGAKSAIYKKEFGEFRDLRTFVKNGGQKGVQRPVLNPGTLAPYHPIGFLIITKNNVYGEPIDGNLLNIKKEEGLTCKSFGIQPEAMTVTVIRPESSVDQIGIVTTLDGDPLPPGDIAGRLGGFDDIKDWGERGAKDTELSEVVIGAKNALHNNYQNFQAFIDNGGKIGLQHDPLLYGAFLLNPFLVKVEKIPMTVVEQGEVAVVKSYVGLPTEDISGATFKYGSLVKPGHRGVWSEPLRTGKYPINTRCYQVEIVPTAILTLNWAKAVSEAHKLDEGLSQIEAKSKEGFIFRIDLQVLIHVSDVKASKVICMVGTMKNLVSEVLQAAVGNHFRDKLQSMAAIDFIQTRQLVQEAAYEHIKGKLLDYEVETLGVYIQDVIFPEQLVKVLTDREIANQQKATYEMQRDAQTKRIETEQQTGLADMQKELAKSRIGVEIKEKNAEARKKEADGEAVYIQKTNAAEGLGKAEGYKAQAEALGMNATALINVIKPLAEKGLKFVPEVQVSGGEGGNLGNTLTALIGTLLTKENSQSEIKIIRRKRGQDKTDTKVDSDKESK